MADGSRSAQPYTQRSRSRLLDWRALLGVAISVVLLWLAFRNTDFAAVAREIRAIDPLLLLLATALTTSTFWIRAWRWKAILQPIKPDIPFRSRFASVTIGFAFNNLLPLRVGEFLRAYSLSRLESVPIVGSFASLVIERFLDGVIIVSFLFLAMALPDFPEIRMRPGTDYTGIAFGAGVVVATGLAVLLLLVFLPRPAVRTMERIVQYLPKRVRRPLIDALESFLTGVGILRNPLLLARAGAWSVVLWLVNSAGFYFAFRAFDIDLPFSAAIFFNSAIGLVVSAPSGPGYVGTYHFGAKTILATMWGVETARAAAYALTYHLAGFIPITLIGLYSAWRIGLTMGEVKGSEETVEVAVEKETGADTIIERRSRPR